MLKILSSLLTVTLFLPALALGNTTSASFSVSLTVVSSCQVQSASFKEKVDVACSSGYTPRPAVKVARAIEYIAAINESEEGSVHMVPVRKVSVIF